jgi:hypothetical protein
MRGGRASAAFHAVVEERLRSLEKQLDEVKGRVNGLIFLIVGADHAGRAGAVQ